MTKSININKEDIEKAIKDLNKSKSDKEIFKIVAKYNKIFKLYLDNDYTGIIFTDNIISSLSEDECNKYENTIKASIKEDIGNRYGVITLLELLNIKSEFC